MTAKTINKFFKRCCKPKDKVVLYTNPHTDVVGRIFKEDRNAPGIVIISCKDNNFFKSHQNHQDCKS